MHLGAQQRKRVRLVEQYPRESRLGSVPLEVDPYQLERVGLLQGSVDLPDVLLGDAF